MSATIDRGRGAARPVTSTYERIYAVIRRIPAGRVATYGQVATLAGLAGRPRLVGYALHASGSRLGLPWHRVLGAGGRITLAKLDHDAAFHQRLRLEAEGVRFTGRGRVGMAAHVWKPGRASTRKRG